MSWRGGKIIIVLRAGTPEDAANKRGLIARTDVAQTDAFQECRWPGILHRRLLCSNILCGPDLYLCILHAPDLCSMMLLGPDLCPRIFHSPDRPVLVHGLNLCSGILCRFCLGTLYRLCLGTLYGLRLGILHGLYRWDLRPCILAGRPRLELT